MKTTPTQASRVIPRNSPSKPTLFAIALAILPAALVSPVFAGVARTDEVVFTQRRDALIDDARGNVPAQQLKEPAWAVRLALLDLFQNRNLEAANRAVLDFCKGDNTEEYVGRTYIRQNGSHIQRIYLLEETRKHLTREAAEAIEDFCWEFLTKHRGHMSQTMARNAETAHFLLPNNGQTNLWRNYTLALRVVSLSERHGPKAMVDGDTIEHNLRTWERFWTRFFQTFP
jgi:hypothetical protein